jgi:hypothetical protein
LDGDWRQLPEDHRQGNAKGAADGIDGGAWSGAQPRAAAIPFDLDFAQVHEVVDDMLPLELLAAMGGKAIEEFLAQHHCEKTAKHVTADGRISLVKDRTSKALAVLNASSTAIKLR